jgi:hypothetical protein
LARRAIEYYREKKTPADFGLLVEPSVAASSYPLQIVQLLHCLEKKTQSYE